MSDALTDAASAEQPLSFWFRGQRIPVTTSAAVSPHQAALTLQSTQFQAWVQRCETSSTADDGAQKIFNIESVEIQSVDLFGARGVGFAKIKSVCTLTVNQGHQQEQVHNLPGICFLRGDAVAILVALFCDDGTVHSLLVDQPRIAIGQLNCLELPAGMLLEDNRGIQGTAIKELEEECGIAIRTSELVDLTELALDDAHKDGRLPMAAIPLSQGGCDEFIRLMYLEKTVTRLQLEALKNKLTGLQEEGEVITLRVVPYEEVWRMSGDSKAIMARFLVDQLRLDNKLPPPGHLATPLPSEPSLSLNSGGTIPQLAFGCYKVPVTDEGEAIFTRAVQAGYRHFDTASIYGNESTLGKVLRNSGIARSEFFIVSKVWNDAQKEGRDSVRKSVLKSLEDLNFGGYFDLFLVHWPVPGYYIETYKELELLHNEGKVRQLGLSNFSIEEYQTLMKSENRISVPPTVNQFEVSPFLYRPTVIEYFQKNANMVVCASKAMYRGGAMANELVQQLALRHNVSPGQIMIRWGVQKRLCVLTMTTKATRMQENRAVFDFTLSHDEMQQLDALTVAEVLQAREALEQERKEQL